VNEGINVGEGGNERRKIMTSRAKMIENGGNGEEGEAEAINNANK